MKATNDLSRLCVHTQTTKPWDLNACITAYHQAGIQHISIWRHLLENQNLKEVKSELEKHHLQPLAFQSFAVSFVCFSSK